MNPHEDALFTRSFTTLLSYLKGGTIMRKESGICELRSVQHPYGSVIELSRKQTSGYIMPHTVSINFYGEKLTPTQYDSFGNPQFSNVARSILTWMIREKVRDGTIDSPHRAQVEYSFSIMPHPTGAILRGYRLPDPYICQVCHEPIYLYQLDGPAPDGVAEIKEYHTVVHADCATEYYRLELIDKLAETVGDALCCYNISDDAEQHLSWGEGADTLSYDLIPNEYCPKPCCADKPWFLFHTPYGDIKIGWRKSLISISLLPGFIEFYQHIFEDENTATHIENGTFTFYASTYGKLHKYLRKLRKNILDRHK